MGTTIFIENLSSSVTGTELTELLSQHGTVESTELAKDDASDEDTQVAFVVMRSSKHGRAVIAALDGETHSGRVLKIKVMKRGGGPMGDSSRGAAGSGALGRGRRTDVFGGRGGVYGHKGRGKAGGRNQ